MLKKRSLWSTVIGLGVLTTMLLAACGSTSSTPTGGGPKQGGNIVDGISQEPSSLMIAQSTQAFAALVKAAIWAPLIYADTQGGFHAGLLTQVPSSSNGGIVISGTTEKVTLKLRPNLKWSDGQALTSDDVAFAITTFSDKTYADDQGFQNSEISNVSTPDPNTVIITLNTVDVTFLVTSLTDVQSFSPLPKHHYSSMTPKDIAADFTPSVTSGPFTVGDRVKGDHIPVQNGSCPVGPDQVAGFDATKAGQLLDSAGWAMGGDGLRHKGSQTLEFRASTTSGRQYRLDSEQLYQAAWKNIGVKIDILNHPSSDLFGPVLFPSDHKYDKSNDQWDIAEFANSLSDPDSHLIWSSDQFPPTGGQNLTYYSSPTVDQLEKTQATQFDQTARKATFKQIYQQLLKDVPTVYLYSAFDLSEYKSNLHNYMPSAVGGVECWNVWDWYLS